MRLYKLTIGSSKNSSTHQFKNLKNVTINFYPEQWVTVLIGWNGTGKSNVLEALAIIFRDLISYNAFPSQKRRPLFAFNLSYRIGSGDKLRFIYINADPDRKKPYIIYIATQEQKDQALEFNNLEEQSDIPPGQLTTLKEFLDNDALNLPRYVFGYYSGESTRMHDLFRPYLERYDKDMRAGRDPGLKRLFFALPVHSQFVLLAFLIKRSEEVQKFLNDHLGLNSVEGIESVLFVLRQPPWKLQHPDGDPRLWHAIGIVRDFLARLYDISLAPVRVKRKVSTSLWNKEDLEFLYLFIKDVKTLRELVGNRSASDFFRDLESTYVSELIEEVRIRIKLKKNDGSITFRELSEGERQLLTVLGLLRFTAEEESLFLLDEPDTHLNPRWTVDYISYLKKFIGTDSAAQDSSHVLLTTHNPMAIAELTKEQVQILHRNNEANLIYVENPEEDPRGMGFAGIITSDMFGLGSSLDPLTNKALLKLHLLSTKKQLTEEDRIELEIISKQLDKLDFNFASRDRLEQEYLRARFDLTDNTQFNSAIITASNKKQALEALVISLLDELNK